MHKRRAHEPQKMPAGENKMHLQNAEKTTELYCVKKYFYGCMVDASGVHIVHACMLLWINDKVDCAMSFDG